MLYEKMEKLKSDYETAVMNYVEFFIIKQQCDFEYWIGEEIGGVAEFSDYFFGFSDIQYDVDNEVEKGLIYKYQDYCVATENTKMNYKSFLKLRPDLKRIDSEVDYGKEPKDTSKINLEMLLENMPENRPIYKDSGLWQIRSDDMEDVVFQQTINEGLFEFIQRVYKQNIGTEPKE